MSAMNVVYQYQNQLYVNLTNRCTNRCKFCIRFTPSGVDGIDLWLEHEPSYEEVVEALQKADYKRYEHIIFCGYGEPLLRADVCLQAAKFIKDTSAAHIRINTNGHGNIYNGRDITPEMEGVIDSVSISLNAPNSEEYREICRPSFGDDAYPAILDFIRECRERISGVTVSVVGGTIPQESEDECARMALDMNVRFRVR